MNQRQIPKGFEIFGAIEPMLHKKPFLKKRNENDVTV
jgi:hypothetical protein